MKRSILILTTALFTTILTTSCSSSAEKVEKAQDEFVEAGKALDNANDEYLKDMENYRKITAEKLNANEESIAQFKLRIESEKKEAKADYNKKIEELEKKNSDVKKKLADYKTEGKTSWELFKAEYNREMEELQKAISSLGNDKK